MLLKLMLFLLLTYCVCGDVFEVITVDTSAGQILGTTGEDFSMFLGIPYGEIDETQPFGDAKPYPFFKTPYNAFNDSAICPQIVKGVPVGTIHCLRLNIYRPNNPSKHDKYPVMVYIHGGGFVEGNGRLTTYSPKFLIRYNVIVVTINFRLGPYGHLCLPNTEYSNQWFKDQTLGLKWVKDNIMSFGGDENNIAAFGHSAGSAALDYLILYNKDNIFNKVILQSGAAIIPYGNEATDSSLFVKDFGLDIENISIDCFIQKISAIDTHEFINRTQNYIFRPCIDGKLITETPKNKDLSHLTIMVGGTMKEMLYFYTNPTKEFCDNFDYGTELKKGFIKVEDGAVDILKQFYYGEYQQNTIEFISDFSFNYPIERSARYYIENNAKVYRYLFNYDGQRNFMKIRENISAKGSTHGDELGYLFDIPLLHANITILDKIIIDRMTSMWTNFAKFGNPTPNWTTKTTLTPVQWSPATATNNYYLKIDYYDQSLLKNPFHTRMAFWELFYAKYGMYAKGISLGENFQSCAENETISQNKTVQVIKDCQRQENKGLTNDLSSILLLLSVILLWQ